MLWWWFIGMFAVLAIAALCVRVSNKDAAIVFSGVGVLAVLAYVLLGSFPALHHHWKVAKEQQTAEALLKTLPSKTVVIDRLEALLKHDPNRPKGWALLGRIRMSQGRVKASIKAYQKAWELKPTEIAYAIGFGEALLLDDQTLPKAVRLQYEKTLKNTSKVSEKAVLLNLLGINAYKEKRFKDAISYWQKALAYFPAGSSDEKQLLEMIHKAQVLLN